MQINSWNLSPNRLWFVRMADAGTGISVGLYLTQADANAQTNRQADGTSSGYGSNLPVTLAGDPGATVPVSLFQPDTPWHLSVSGSLGDPVASFRIKEFVELNAIEAPLFRNAALIPLRAAAEIDAHTHVETAWSVSLGRPFQSAKPGDVFLIDSARAGAPILAQCTSHTLRGDPNSLTSTLELASYQPLKR